MQDWLITVISLAGSTCVTAFVSLIIKSTINKKFKEQDELRILRAEKSEQEREKVIKTTVSESLLPVTDKFDELSTKLDTIAHGTQAVLRDRLIQLYNYCSGQGYATLSQKQNFENMYTKYHMLGQNGVMDSCYEKLMALPEELKH